jgi:hypothetical protein
VTGTNQKGLKGLLITGGEPLPREALPVCAWPVTYFLCLFENRDI